MVVDSGSRSAESQVSEIPEGEMMWSVEDVN